MVYRTEEPDPLQQIFDMVAGNTGIVTAQQLEKLAAGFRKNLVEEQLPEEQRRKMSAVIAQIEGVLRSMSLDGLSKIDFVQFLEFARGGGASPPGGAGAPPAGPSYAPAAPATTAPTNSKKSGGGTLFVLAALAAVVYNLK